MSEGESLKAVLSFGRYAEDTFFGLKTTGVRSYSDLAANYYGLRFWQDLTDKKNPILKCQDGIWTILRNPTFADYVDDAWDEAINCSEFSDSRAKVVSANISYLERSRGKRYRCPIDQKACVDLAVKYSGVQDDILSPQCVDSRAKNGGIENRRGVK